MKAVIYEAFGVLPELKNVPDPKLETHGVVVKVMATGVCRSDWHGWLGHDADIRPPHGPGHELAGVVAAGGKSVKTGEGGERGPGAFGGGVGALPTVANGNARHGRS